MDRRGRRGFLRGRGLRAERRTDGSDHRGGGDRFEEFTTIGHDDLLTGASVWPSAFQDASEKRLRSEPDKIAHRREFVRVNRVAHSLIDALVHAGAHPAKHFGGFAHALERNVRVDVTTPQKNRGVLH